jgi:hypothetical protein
MDNAQKQCTRCHTLKPLPEFSRKRQSSSDGYSTACKVCRRAAFRAWYLANREKPPKPPETARLCRGCLQELPLDAFPMRNGRRHGYRCRQCRYRDNVAWRLMNPEKVLQWKMENAWRTAGYQRRVREKRKAMAEGVEML